jgi:hypothetical protein
LVEEYHIGILGNKIKLGLGYRVSIPDGHWTSFFASNSGAPKQERGCGVAAPPPNRNLKRNIDLVHTKIKNV